MLRAPFEHIDPVTRSTGAALLCSILTQHLSSRQSELYSETLCWMVLPVALKIAKRPDVDKLSKGTAPSSLAAHPASASSLWVVALSIATFCIFKAENGMVGFLPALTPLFLVAQKYLKFELYTSATPNSWFSPFVNTVWGTTLVASFGIVTLTDWDLRGYALSIIPVTALLTVCIILTPKIGKGSKYLPPFDIEDAILRLSLRLVAVLIITLGVDTAVFGVSASNVAATLVLGLTKALSWYFMIHTIQHSSWLTATAIGTFSTVSTCDPFLQSSGAQALSHVITSFIALSQVIHILPKQAKAKSALWALSFVSFGPYLANILAIKIGQSSLVIHSQKHPIELLTRNAKADFEGLLQKQSKSYTAAYEEYRRRYGVDPPPGFEAWYEFATSHQSPIIDEFDMIYDGVSPFWRLSGKEVLEIISDVQNEPNSELWLCSFSGQEAKTYCSHRHRSYDRHIQFLFDRVLEDLRGVLPDAKFLVNHLDEPRVLISPRSLGRDSQGDGKFNVTNMSRQPVWDMLTKFCPSQDRKGSIQTRHTGDAFGLPFVTESTLAMDLCLHPEYSAMHGFALSPTSFQLIEGLVPILSTGSLSTMGDILYPSPAYIESEFQYADAHDVEWDKKRNNLYWAGSSTGGFAVDDQWKYYHRQRFVQLTQNLERRQHYYLQERDGVISRVKSSFLNSRLFDVAFTKIFQCERKYCRDQRAYFNVKSWADKDQAFRSRLVFDMDGNGISGRYYRLLASKSAPLKQTILREWHDERLAPWVHYIPVSQSMEELPELVVYLTSTESGQKKAREIANQGRDWFAKAFREVDLTIYTYRLLLELARLQDPDRPAWEVGTE
ncbi:hypothetical protein F5B20DRAFT_521105 [Whalleya microplaca]|nr:hypothetical protein F5B20DRAFT_521105 [Whalleya microplaca]